MANRNNRYTSMKVSPKYFDGWFEKERRKASNKLGVNFTQRNFTEYIAVSGAKLVFPKKKNTFGPRRPRNNGGFSFNL